jgi:hypothetical protein
VSEIPARWRKRRGERERRWRGWKGCEKRWWALLGPRLGLLLV